MSPRKVSLAGMELLKSVADEPLAEKVDSAGLPAVIILESERHTIQLRQEWKRRQCRILVCVFASVVFLAAAAVITFAVVKVLSTHRKNWSIGHENGYAADVSVDDTNKLIHAKQTQNDQGKKTPMEILHEYDRGLVAYRDMDNNICYIDRLDETFEDGYARWQSYETNEKDPQALKVISQPIEKELLFHFMDVHIYSHCENGNSVWVMEIEKQKITAEMVVVYV